MTEIAQKAIEIPIKDQAYTILRREGFTNIETSKALGVTKQTGHNMQKRTEKLPDLLTSIRLKRALTASDKIMRGKPWGAIKEIKASDVTANIKMLLDRSHPLINHNLNVNVMADFTEVDLSLVGGQPPKKAPPEVIEVKPEVKRKIKNCKRCECGGMKGHRGPHRKKKPQKIGQKRDALGRIMAKGVGGEGEKG